MMSRHFLCFNCLLCLFLCWGITGQVKAQDTKTVSVDCTSGKGKGKGVAATVSTKSWERISTRY